MWLWMTYCYDAFALNTHRRTYKHTRSVKSIDYTSVKWKTNKKKKEKKRMGVAIVLEIKEAELTAR